MRRADIAVRHTGLTKSEVTLSVSGELDMSTIDVLAGQVDAHLQWPVDCLTLDLSDLEFMDSTGLRLLIELSDRARQERWRLELVGPRHEAASRVLKITGADVALPFRQETPR